MTDFVLPPDLIASEVTWGTIDNTAVFSSALSGAVRTYSRPGNRWTCRMVFRAPMPIRRARLLSLIAQLRGRSNRLYLTDPSYTAGGSFSAPELVTNQAATAATTGWTSSNAEMVLSADSNRGLRLARTGVTADRYAYQAGVATVASAPYAIRAIVAAGKGAVNLKATAGTSQGDTSLRNGTALTAAGRLTETFTASGTTSHVSFYDLIAGRAANDFQFINWASVARCALVNGASQTGAALNIDGLPASTNALAKAGDWVEIGGELKRLVADLNSNGSGEGYLIFEPQLRASPVDNAPVVFRSPMGRFLLSDDSVGWSVRPGIIGDIELNLVEDLA